ncbi:MAG: hypothetical protein ACN6O3_21225 [Comamonas sp.]
MAAVRPAAPGLLRPQGYPAVAGRHLRRWIAILGALPLVVLAAWAAGGEGWSWRVALAALLWLACWCWALAGVGHPAPTQLYWDGAAWWLRAPGQPPAALAVAQLRVAMDGQRWLLLRLRLDGGRIRWLVLHGAANPAAWLELRRCLYSSA